MRRCTRSSLRIDAASCGSHRDAGHGHRRRHPACYLGVIRMWVGFVLGGPPGRRMARQPAASCGLTGRAMDDRSAGVHAGGAPSSDNVTDQCAIDRRATPRVARRCAIRKRGPHHICAKARACPTRREPGKEARLPSAPSRTNGRRQDAAGVSQSVGRSADPPRGPHCNQEYFRRTRRSRSTISSSNSELATTPRAITQRPVKLGVFCLTISLRRGQLVARDSCPRPPCGIPARVRKVGGGRMPATIQ